MRRMQERSEPHAVSIPRTSHAFGSPHRSCPSSPSLPPRSAPLPSPYPPFPPFYTRHPAFGRPEGKVTGVRNGVRERRTSEGSEEPKEPNGLNEDHE